MQVRLADKDRDSLWSDGHFHRESICRRDRLSGGSPGSLIAYNFVSEHICFLYFL